MSPSIRLLGLASLSLLLVACGGGGKKSTPVTPTPTAQAYVISGFVNGLNGTVVLAVNGGADVTVTSNGSTTVALTTSLLPGAAYTVTVKTQPPTPAQICTITGGSGTTPASAATPITGLTVTCVLNTISLVSSTPTTGAIKQSCAVAPKLVFNKPVDAATANANITFTHGATAVPFTLAVSGAEVTVTPTSKLDKLVDYTLTANTGLRGTGAEVLMAPVVVTFSCDGAFGTAAVFPKEAGSDASNPIIVMDDNGNGFALWNAIDNGVYNVYARRYTPAGGWATAEIIEHQSTDSYTPSLGFDGAGNALVVFLVNDGISPNSTYANRWTAADGWGMEEEIDAMTGDTENAQLAVNANGQAVASWYQSDPSVGGWYRAVANVYTPGSGWGAPLVLDTAVNANAFNPRPGIDADGNALVLWQQRGGSWGNDIWSRHFTAGTGWDPTPVLVENSNAGAANTPRVKFDGEGKALAVWYQNDGTRFNVMSNRYEPGAGWGNPIAISNGAGDALLPRLDMNAAGDVIVAWYQNDGTHFNTWATTYTPTGDWTMPVMLETDDAGDVGVPWVAIDAAGNGIVTWDQSNGTSSHIWASRYSKTSGFGTRQRVDNDDATSSDSPWVAMSPDGDALITWQAFDGVLFSIWANTFH